MYDLWSIHRLQGWIKTVYLAFSRHTVSEFLTSDWQFQNFWQMGWVGEDYGSLLHNSMFWGVFLGLQPSGAAARLCVPAEWFQRILLTTVANTQPERAVQYGMDAIATASFKEGIQTYNIRLVCTVIRYIQYLQYLIPQPPVIRYIQNLQYLIPQPPVIRYIQYLQYLIPQPPVRLKVDKKSITIFKLIQYLLYNKRNLGRNLQYWQCIALLPKHVNSGTCVTTNIT